MKIEIKRWDDGEVIFSHDCDDNSISITLEEGVSHGANLQYANLYNADLQYANLYNAKLQDVNLQYANLQYANLHGANLQYAKLPKHNIVINDRWHIHITIDYIKIGCKQHPYSWWKNLSFKVAESKFSAGDWWKQWKPVILAIYESFK